MFKSTCCGGKNPKSIVEDVHKNNNLNGKDHLKEKDRNEETKTMDKLNDASEYKLTYFNARIGGEAIRLMFHLKEAKFEDFRVEDDAAGWGTLKPYTKWQKLPVLEHDGASIYSYSAILRYLAKKFNLLGTSDLDNALCDEYFDVCQDLRTGWTLFFDETNEEKKQEYKENLVNQKFPVILRKFNEIVEKNNEGPWLVGRTHTWVDLVLANLLEILEDTVDPSVLEAYVGLMTLKESVFAFPEIMKYIETRPETSH